MGFLSKRYIKSDKKRNWLVITVDIITILVFIWWALNERASYIQGVNDCALAWCGALPNMTNYNYFCPANYSMFGRAYNISEFNKAFTSTGTELPPGINLTFYNNSNTPNINISNISINYNITIYND